MPVRAVALLVAIALVAIVLMGACSSGDDDVSGASRESARAPGATNDSTLAWEACGGVECATLDVPLDYDDPDGETIALAVARRRADGNAAGTVVTNPGGPGVRGVPLVESAELYFPSELLDRFDIVSWDPRGAGESAPIDCVDSLDAFYATDKSPDTEAEVDALFAEADAFVAGCEERSGDLLPHVGTASTVLDLESIRVALGDDAITYLGFSYGSYIGALYADRFPDRVRAMVLDGAVDPSLTFEELSVGQSIGFDAALEAFLDDCARTDCGFGGNNPHESYGLAIDAIDAETVFAEVGGEERGLGPGEADLGVARALYDGERGWAILAEALRTAVQGDGSELLRLADAYTGREPGGEYSNQTEAFYAIGCLDGPVPGRDEFDDVAAEVAAQAPAFGAATVYLSSPCALWPVAAEGEPAEVDATGAPPIVVIGTSNDPATPLAWAESLATQLESGRLVVMNGEGHTAYGRDNDCVDDLVHAYLIDLEAPPRKSAC